MKLRLCPYPLLLPLPPPNLTSSASTAACASLMPGYSCSSLPTSRGSRWWSQKKKIKRIDEGVLENVNAIFGLHVDPKLPLGEVAARPGPLLAGSGFFEALISGKGSHAAIPQHPRGPILAASNVIVSLQHLVLREADPLDSQVVTVAKFQGGGAFNVIPDSVAIGGAFRAFSKQSFMQLRERIEEVITGQAAVQRCKAIVNFHEKGNSYIPPTINDKDLHEHFRVVAGDVLGDIKVKDMQPSTRAEDFSFFKRLGLDTFLSGKAECNAEKA